MAAKILIIISAIFLLVFIFLSPICDILGIFGRLRKVVEWAFVILGTAAAIFLALYAITS